MKRVINISNRSININGTVINPKSYITFEDDLDDVTKSCLRRFQSLNLIKVFEHENNNEINKIEDNIEDEVIEEPVNESKKSKNKKSKNK